MTFTYFKLRRPRPVPVSPEANLWIDSGRVPHPPSGRAHRSFFVDALGSCLRGCMIALGATVCLAFPGQAIAADPLTTLPQTPIHGCRGGKAKLYDECHAQAPIFDKALRKARGQGKTLLVSFGAEWCIWCHVFDAYVTGEHGAFTHTYGDPDDTERVTATIHERADNDPSGAAADLAGFVADNFVLVHIDLQYAPDGWDVIDRAGAMEGYGNWIPYVFTTDRDGMFAAALKRESVETRRDTEDWFRGYDRAALKAELTRMMEAAQ